MTVFRVARSLDAQVPSCRSSAAHDELRADGTVAAAAAVAVLYRTFATQRVALAVAVRGGVVRTHVDVADDVPFDVLVERVRAATADPHRERDRLAEDARAEADACVVYRDASASRTPSLHELDASVAIVCHAADRAPAIAVYATGDANAARRTAGHVDTILAAACARATSPVAALPMLTADEIDELRRWNATATPYPAAATAVETIRCAARRSPGATAVADERTELTYAELDQRVERLAAYLEPLGVAPEVPVAIALERSVDFVVAAFAVHRAGGAYVPVDPDYPADRVAFMLEDSRAPVMITSEAVRANLPLRGGVAVVSLDRDADAIARDRRVARLTDVRGNDLAYVMYTSGSTGRPKGVRIDHRALMNLIVGLRPTGLGASDTVVALAPFSFDASVSDLFATPAYGGRTVIAPRAAARDPRVLGTLLERCGATVMLATPTTWRMLVEAGWTGSRRLNAWCGGEALTPDLAAKLLARCASVWNHYGPTETTVTATLERVVEAESISVGRPMANVRTYVVNSAMQPVPVGVTGELCIGGDGVARDYLGRTDLTSERFVVDPFAGEPGARMYRTGDIARFRADGRIDVLGRADDQVKVRGHRIELGEIEAALESCDGVAQAVVALHARGAERTELLAYYVPSRVPPSPAALRTQLGARLPDFMVPAVFMPLDALPVGPSGKVERGALPVPDVASARSRSVPYVAPSTPVEHVLLDVVAESLGAEPANVGVDDDFFELGGQSILAMRVVARASTLLRTRLSVRDFFQHATVRALGAAVASDAHARARAEAVARSVLALRAMTPEERERRAAATSGRDAPAQGPAAATPTLPELFVRAARESPSATALAMGTTTMSYAELDAATDALAATLVRDGIGAGALVGVCMRRSPELVVALLGVLKAGAAYVPIDASYPRARIEYMLEASAAPLVLTHADLVETLPRTNARVAVARADGTLDDDPSPSRERIAIRATPDAPAYVIFTSGSTGRPKGAMIAHRGLGNYLQWAADAYDVRAGIGSPVHSSISFDLTVTSLWTPLIAGRTAFLVPEDEGVEALAAVLRAHRNFSLVKITPAHLDLLRNQLGADDAADRTRLFVVGGEALAGESLAWWQTHAPRTVFVNEYGPTETVVGCCVQFVGSDRRITGQVPIGRAIAGMQLYVLDDAGAPVPDRELGELYIGGAGVGIGYLNDPEQTARRFVPDPFAGGDARMYRTGDLARRNADGTLEFAGRIDDQVKVRGYRIELGEIKAALERLPEVDAATVVVRNRESGEAALIGYVTHVTGASLSALALRRRLGAWLPSYMVPDAIVVLDALPLTANGKVDRDRLPAPTFALGAEHDVVPPRTPLEQQLAEIWQDVLGIRPIGVTNDFFELGATSIVAARLFDRIERELGAKLPLSPIFRAPTIEKLAALLEAEHPGSARMTSLVPIQPHGDGAPIFCVHGGTGTALHFARLARALGEAQPFYGLQMQGLYGDAPPHLTIEAMAAHYVDEIRTVAPHGPYVLAGYCFGGLIAYEMAVRLTRAGERVSWVVMLNGAAPRYGGRVVANAPHAAPRRGPLQRLRYALKLRQRATMLACVLLKKPVPTELREAVFPDICTAAEARYRAPRYGGPLLIVNGHGLHADPALGWKRYADGDVRAINVPGRHLDARDSLVEPAVSYVAEQLRMVLSDQHDGHVAPARTEVLSATGHEA